MFLGGGVSAAAVSHDKHGVCYAVSDGCDHLLCGHEQESWGALYENYRIQKLWQKALRDGWSLKYSGCLSVPVILDFFVLNLHIFVVCLSFLCLCSLFLCHFVNSFFPLCRDFCVTLYLFCCLLVRVSVCSCFLSFCNYVKHNTLFCAHILSNSDMSSVWIAYLRI